MTPTKIIDWKLGLCLMLGFIVFTIIGTLSHELGHYSVARMLGYKASINYGFSTWEETDERWNEARREQDPSYYKKIRRDGLLIAMGGPLQTIVTGSIGCWLLYWQRRKFFAATQMSFAQWVLVFLSLFWLRPLFNFLVGILQWMANGSFAAGGDEIGIARGLDLPPISIALISALLAAIVLSIVVFKYIPKTQRLTFIAFGAFGALFGFYVWMIALGPVIMP